MTYEKKLDIILNAIFEAKKATRKKQPTRLWYENSDNGLDKLNRDEVHDILLKLQEEKVIKVHKRVNRLLSPHEQPVNPGYFSIEVPENFEVKHRKHPAKTVGNKSTKPVSKIEWSKNFKWKGKEFIFGKHGKRIFNSKTTITLFHSLTNAKGNWVTVKELKEVSGKNEQYVRPTIGQIERSLKPEIRKYISIPSTEDDNLQPKPHVGAYRIKFTPKSL